MKVPLSGCFFLLLISFRNFVISKFFNIFVKGKTNKKI